MANDTTLQDDNPVIPVRDMAATVAFYEDKLGFRKAFDDAAQPGGPINYAGVCRGGICLHLQTTAPDENATAPQIRIRVTNIEPLYEEYQAQGLIGPGGHLEPKPWGSKDFGLYDPNRTALVFYEDL